MKRVIVILLLTYIGGYLIFRPMHIEVWEQDKQRYLMFPSSLTGLYYLWRPLTYVDGAMTGMRFHIGPHR